MGNMVNRKRAW